MTDKKSSKQVSKLHSKLVIYIFGRKFKNFKISTVVQKDGRLVLLLFFLVFVLFIVFVFC